MTILAVILSLVTLALAGVHFLWAIGYWFPIRDEEALVRTVVGVKGVERMPGPIPCALIVVGLLVAAVLPWWGEGNLRDWLLGVTALVFLGRGVVSYLPSWRRLTPQQPYARLDRQYYGPMCLALGFGYIVLLIA